MKNLRLLFVFLFITGVLSAQIRYKTIIPDIPGYKTLQCDFHTHTIFSDGSVMPAVRVDEAMQEGLDAIAITDHIEYRPWHRQNIVQSDLTKPTQWLLAMPGQNQAM